MHTETQPIEGQRKHISRKTGPYTLLDTGTIVEVIKITQFSLNFKYMPLILQ